MKTSYYYYCSTTNYVRVKGTSQGFLYAKRVIFEPLLLACLGWIFHDIHDILTLYVQIITFLSLFFETRGCSFIKFIIYYYYQLLGSDYSLHGYYAITSKMCSKSSINSYTAKYKYINFEFDRSYSTSSGYGHGFMAGYIQYGEQEGHIPYEAQRLYLVDS